MNDLDRIQREVDARIEAVIFDCDGVVVDSVRESHQAIVDALGARGHALSLDECKARFLGQPLTSVIAYAADLDLPSGATLKDDIESRYMVIAKGKLRVMPGAMVMVGSLATRALIALAASSSQKKTRFTLSEVGFSGAFGVVVTSDDVSKPKPAPDAILLCAKRLGVDPTRVLYVDDAPVGIEAARACGAMAIGHSGTVGREALEAAGADFVVDSLQTLRTILRHKGRTS
ncbi:MAG: HAD family hydrolase [Polyangiales bacterium]